MDFRVPGCQPTREHCLRSIRLYYAEKGQGREQPRWARAKDYVGFAESPSIGELKWQNNLQPTPVRFDIRGSGRASFHGPQQPKHSFGRIRPAAPDHPSVEQYVCGGGREQSRTFILPRGIAECLEKSDAGGVLSARITCEILAGRSTTFVRATQCVAELHEVDVRRCESGIERYRFPESITNTFFTDVEDAPVPIVKARFSHGVPHLGIVGVPGRCRVNRGEEPARERPLETIGIAALERRAQGIGGDE